MSRSTRPRAAPPATGCRSVPGVNALARGPGCTVAGPTLDEDQDERSIAQRSPSEDGRLNAVPRTCRDEL